MIKSDLGFQVDSASSQTYPFTPLICQKGISFVDFHGQKENQILHRSLDLKNKRPKIHFEDRLMYSILSKLPDKMRKHQEKVSQSSYPESFCH